MLLRARRAGDLAVELLMRRSSQGVLLAEHAAFAVLLASGALLAWRLGWGVSHARWFGIKVGLVIFLLVPLEGMHAWVCHAWIARGLEETPSPPFSRDLLRGVGMEEIIRTLEVVLLGVAVPLVVWLSLARPF